LTEVAAVASRRRASIGSRGRIGRAELFLWVAVCLFANHAFQVIDFRSLEALGASLATLNIILWFACYVVLRRLWEADGGEPADAVDVLVAVATGLLILFTSLMTTRYSAGASATAMALYLLARHRDDAHLKAAGAVLLALSVHLVWGPVIFLFFTPELLRVDAVLVGGMFKALRPDIVWNDTRFASPSGHEVALIGGCSSFHNISSALLACASVAMLVRTEWRRSDILVALVASLAMVGINVGRICLLGWSTQAYQFWHEGAGSPILVLLQTAVIMAIAYWGIVARAGAR
jgi:exosortase/archaeosortase family protein